MVKSGSIQFDVAAALRRAQALKISTGMDDLKEWARRSDVSIPTLRSFLREEPGIKFRTVDRIMEPLGWTAADIIRRQKQRTA